MFPKEDYLYKTASLAGIVIGSTEIFLSGFILRGYFNASQKVLQVYREFNLDIGSGFMWGYISIGVLLLLGGLTLVLSILLKKSASETRGLLYGFLAPLLFLGIAMAFICIFTFQKLVVFPVVNLPDNI